MTGTSELPVRELYVYTIQVFSSLILLHPDTEMPDTDENICILRFENAHDHQGKRAFYLFSDSHILSLSLFHTAEQLKYFVPHTGEKPKRSCLRYKTMTFFLLVTLKLNAFKQQSLFKLGMRLFMPWK